MSEPILVDPKVSRIKFNKEVNDLLKLAPELRKRGWIIELVKYPTVRVTFLLAQINPPIALLTAEIDFTNYNYLPPSVKFLHPVSSQPVNYPALQVPGDLKSNRMIAGHPETNLPFLCLPGVREYHSHPQHNGDSWDMHRYTGEGGLYFLLNHIEQYCVKTIVNCLLQVTFTQFALNYGVKVEQ